MLSACRYELVEIDAAKRVRLVLPSGKVKILEPFLKQNVLFEYSEEGFEYIKKNGEAKSIVRFFPDEAGLYKAETDGKTVEINVSENPVDHGYIKVSETDKRYFSYTDDTAYMPIGLNLAFISPVGRSNNKEFGLSGERSYLGMKQYERWFKECSKNGVNMARIWLGHEYFCPDTEEAGRFDLVQFAKIDALLALAEKYGIRLKLTIEQFRFFDYEREAESDSYADDVFRKFRKRLYMNGRRCESSEEWMTDPSWQEMWLVKMRELAKRISGNTTVFAVELWNEMNCMPLKYLNEWNKKMLPAVKELFPQHLVMNSLGSFDAEWVNDIYSGFCWDLCDIKQMHRYLDLGAEYDVCKGNVIDVLRDGTNRLKTPNKPFLVAETGAVNECHSGPFRYYVSDHRGIIFCDSVYTPLFCGSAGCGNIWHWDERYVEFKNLYKYFKPLGELCRGVEFDKEEFICDCYEDGDVILLMLRGKNHTLGYLRNKADNWMRVLRDIGDDLPVSEKKIDINVVGIFEVFKIWDEETAEITYGKGVLDIKNLKYGALFKIKHRGENI